MPYVEAPLSRNLATANGPAHSLKAYIRALEEQEEILAQELDHHALLSGLSRMSRLEDLEVTTLFVCVDKDTTLTTPHHTWYWEKTQKTFAGILLPSGFGDNETYKFSYNDDYDQRGLQHLFQAVSAAGNNLIDMRIGKASNSHARSTSREFFGAYAPASFLANLPLTRIESSTLVQNLVTLNLTAGLSPRMGTKLGVSTQMKIHRILKTAWCLENLSFAFIYRMDALVWRWIFSGQHWPAWHYLDLRDATLHAQDLYTILDDHKTTLRRLQLRGNQHMAI